MWYINQIDDDTFILYVRISFFNANTGKIIVFQNSNYTINSASPDKMFFRMILNKNTKIFNNSTPINVRELINSEEYIEKFNNTFENFNNLKQLFPNGSVFDFETGTYINNNS